LIGCAGSVLWLELGVEGSVEAGVEVMRVFLQVVQVGVKPGFCLIRYLE